MSFWFKTYYKPLLVIILFFSFFTRVWRIDIPPRYIFDEVYHAVTAKLISHNDPRAFEWWNAEPEPNTAVDWLHPPLAKYFQASSMLLLGENTLGWRFSSAIFGVLVVMMVAKLSMAIFENESLALMAAFLASMDGLLLTMSRIAMNDIHVTFFILLTLYWYVRHVKQRRGRQKLTTGFFWLTGIAAGLAMATKWSGVFVLASVWIFEFIYILKMIWSERWTGIKNNLSAVLIYPLALFLIPLCIYVGSYWQMFAQGKSLFCFESVYIEENCYFEENNIPFADDYVSHFSELHHQIWSYQISLEATHGYQSRPYEWFLNLKPVWFHVDYQDESRADIYALGNPVLQWLGVISVLVIMLIMLKQWVEYLVRGKTSNSMFSKMEITGLSFLVTSYLFVWIFWQFSPRIMFYYHYTPATALLCILLAWALIKISRIKLLTPTLVSLIIIAFVIWYPHWTGIQVPLDLKQKVYFGLDSWQ